MNLFWKLSIPLVFVLFMTDSKAQVNKIEFGKHQFPANHLKTYGDCTEEENNSIQFNSNQILGQQDSLCPGEFVLNWYENPNNYEVSNYYWSVFENNTGEIEGAANEDSVLLSHGTYLFEVFYDNGCYRNLIFEVEPLFPGINEPSETLNACLNTELEIIGLENQDCGLVHQQIFGSCGEDAATFDFYINQEYQFSSGLLNCFFPNEFISAPVCNGDLLEIYYNASTEYEPPTFIISICSNSPEDLISIETGSESGWIYSAEVDCESEAIAGIWEIVEAPGDINFEEANQYNTTIVAESSGVYELSFTSELCNTTQVLTVDVANAPPSITAPSELLLCPDCELTINVTIDAGTSPYTVLWSTGEQNVSMITVNQPGIYTIYATNACGTSSEEITVIQQLSPGQDYDQFEPNWLTQINSQLVPPKPNLPADKTGSWELCLNAQLQLEWIWLYESCSAFRNFKDDSESNRNLIYPNPSSGIFSIISNSNGIIPEFKIFDAQGKEHEYIDNGYNFEIRIPGIYLVLFEDGRFDKILVE